MEETLKQDDINVCAIGLNIKTGIKAGYAYWSDEENDYGEGEDWEFNLSEWDYVEYL